MSTTRTPEERSETEQALWDLPWVISTMESQTADFVVQADTPYCGMEEFEVMEELGVTIQAISSHGPNGFLRIHVSE